MKRPGPFLVAFGGHVTATFAAFCVLLLSSCAHTQKLSHHEPLYFRRGSADSFRVQIDGKWMTAKELTEEERKFNEAGSTPPFLDDGYPPDWLQLNATASESDLFDERIIPGTYYTLAWRRRVMGTGSPPETGDTVRVIFRGHLVEVPDITVLEGTLAFVIGDSLVGPGIQAAVMLMRTGAVHDIELREEVAKGIREAWADLPPRSRLRLVLRRQ